MYKIVKNQTELNFEDYFVVQSTPYSLRNHNKIKPTNNFKCNTWQGSYFERASRYWNNLNKNVVLAKSLTTFKEKLKMVNYDKISQPY